MQRNTRKINLELLSWSCDIMCTTDAVEQSGEDWSEELE